MVETRVEISTRYATELLKSIWNQNTFSNTLNLSINVR